MPIPTYESLFLPLLKQLADGDEHSIKDVTAHFDRTLDLTDAEREKRLPSGVLLLSNRVGWARTYLKKAELLDYPRRGFMKATSEGLKLLATAPKSLRVSDLKKLPNFESNWIRSGGDPVVRPIIGPEGLTPEETIEAAFTEISRKLSTELLDQISKCSPSFFERLVVELLLKMGYGGSFADAGRAIGKSGDGGIDGIIKEDKLGLDLIHIQAKRWENTVGRPEIQRFMGALAGNRAKKGVFITTSAFTSEARQYASTIDAKIVLIDGGLLTELMIEHEVGVSVESTRTIKRVDADYFTEE